jgi:DNA-binding MarR family transcriptional regulator
MNGFDLARFLPFRLNRLAAEVSERLSTLYAEQFGLDIPQWRVLATLSSAEPTTAQTIVASTRTHKSTISRAVQQLEDRELIERVPSPDDGRAFELQLTAKGRKLFAELKPIVLAYERKLLAQLEKDDSNALLQGIAALEASLNLGAEDTK